MLSIRSAGADTARRRTPARDQILSGPAVAAALALWALSLSLLFHGRIGPDDSFFLETAHLWLSGAPPYSAVFDVKPPGLFALIAAMELVFGPNQAAVHALSTLCDFGTAICLLRLGRRWGAPEAGVFAAAAFPLLSRMLAANSAYPPLMAAIAAAFVFAAPDLDWRRRAGFAGLAIGFAATIKQTAALEALALLWVLLRESPARERGRVTLLFLAAALAAPLFFALVLNAQGAFRAMIDDAVIDASLRSQLENAPLPVVLARFLSLQAKVLPLVAAAALAVRRPGAAAPLAWLAASWIGLYLQHARWLGYIGPTLAPLLLLAGMGASQAFRDFKLRGVALAALLLVEFAGAYPFRAWAYMDPETDQDLDGAALTIAGRRPATEDRLLAIAYGEQLNLRLGLAPPTPYFHSLHLLCNFPGAGLERLQEALAARPRFIVRSASTPNHHCQDPRAWPTIAEALARDYVVLHQGQNFAVYEVHEAR